PHGAPESMDHHEELFAFEGAQPSRQAHRSELRILEGRPPGSRGGLRHGTQTTDEKGGDRRVVPGPSEPVTGESPRLPEKGLLRAPVERSSALGGAVRRASSSIHREHGLRCGPKRRTPSTVRPDSAPPTVRQGFVEAGPNSAARARLYT